MRSASRLPRYGAFLCLAGLVIGCGGGPKQDPVPPDKAMQVMELKPAKAKGAGMPGMGGGAAMPGMSGKK